MRLIGKIRLGIVALGFFGALMIASTPTVDATSVITQKRSQGWEFKSDGGIAGSGSYVYGPQTASIGEGSAELRINSGSENFTLWKKAYGGLTLKDINVLSYDTFVSQGNKKAAPSLQFNFDPDVTDNKNNWYGRLIYEPSLNGTVEDGKWQTWDAQKGGDAKWWMSWENAVKDDYGTTNPCPRDAPCTLGQIRILMPKSGIHHGQMAGVVFKAVIDGNSPLKSSVDAFSIGTPTGIEVYNFEPVISPASKDECNNDGWKRFNNPTFDSQQECFDHGKSQGNALVKFFKRLF